MLTNSEIQSNLYDLANQYGEGSRLDNIAIYVLSDILQAFTGVSCETSVLGNISGRVFMRKIAGALSEPQEAGETTPVNRPIFHLKRKHDAIKPDELMAMAEFYDNMIKKYGILITPGEEVQYCGIINTEEEMKNA